MSEWTRLLASGCGALKQVTLTQSLFFLCASCREQGRKSVECHQPSAAVFLPGLPLARRPASRVHFSLAYVALGLPAPRADADCPKTEKNSHASIEPPLARERPNEAVRRLHAMQLAHTTLLYYYYYCCCSGERRARSKGGSGRVWDTTTGGVPKVEFLLSVCRGERERERGERRF